MGKPATDQHGKAFCSSLGKQETNYTQTRVAVYHACIVSTSLYGSESWTIYTSQEKRLNIFHMRCLRRILFISWTDKVSNNEALERAEISSVFTLLQQRRLRWLGHVHRMEDEPANPQGRAVW